MELTDLKLEKQTYGPNKGKFEGTARFAGKGGSIYLNLKSEHCTKILELCAESIMEVSGEVAKAFVIEAREVIDVSQTKRLND